jgi:tRNA 2-thiocytidine biosynthesis protein TtcA
VSGGVDSLILLLLLIEYNHRFKKQWDIRACHVDHQFPKSDTTPLRDFLVACGIPYTIIKTKALPAIEKADKKCYRCARERRRKLLEVAENNDIFQIALAHHKQDVCETLLLNMIYNGEMSTLVPKQSVIQGRFFFVRPLYYIDKRQIETIAELYRLSPIRTLCPYYQDSKRESVREFLETIKKDNPDVYTNVFRSVYHVRHTYMP